MTKEKNFKAEEKVKILREHLENRTAISELAEKVIRLTAKDENGSIYYDGNITTLKHGFFEIWLPRNKNIKLQMSYNSLSGEEIITTRNDSRTCITTIKLK